MADEVLYEVIDRVCVITLNRPATLNAMNYALMDALTSAVERAEMDRDAGCVVVTGAGRGFCSGGDLGVMPYAAQVTESETQASFVPRGRTEEDRIRSGQKSGNMASRILHNMAKPTIAMINGPGAGAGIGLAGACDLRFAAQSATFLSAFNKHGFSGDYGSTWFWTKILGSGRAREIHILGEKIDAGRAYEIGIFTKVFADDQLREATMEVARRIAAGSPVGWGYMKDNLNLAEDGIFDRAMDNEGRNMGLAMREAARARRARRQVDKA